MTSSTAPAQKRLTRTRTKNVSHRPELLLSSLPLLNVSLFPGMEHLVCPDCKTWCPITGAQSKTPKLVPHHTERAGTPGARRCSGSNRRVVIDVTIAAWEERCFDAATETAARRSTKVMPKKPVVPAAPAVTQMNPVTLRARKELADHMVSDCRACRSGRFCEPALLLRRWAKRTETELANLSQVPQSSTPNRVRNTA
jgi:hypothetical protein